MSQIPETPTPEENPTHDDSEIRAVLPDFDAPERVVKASRETAANSVLSGCAVGVLLNFALGFVVLGLQKVGVPLYGPGAVAIAVALVVLLAVLREWPRRTLLGFAGVIAGMMFTFLVLRLLLQPLLQSAPDDATLRETAPTQTAPRGDAGENNS